MTIAAFMGEKNPDSPWVSEGSQSAGSSQSSSSSSSESLANEESEQQYHEGGENRHAAGYEAFCAE